VRTPYQVGVPYDWFQSEQIIGLDSLLSYLEEFHSQAFLHIDIRHYSLCLGPKENEQRMYGLVDTLLECLHRSEFPLENILLNSSSFELCNYIKEESKEIAVSFEVIEDVEMWLPKVHAAGIKFVTIKPRLLNKELSRRIHNKGIQIVTFGGARKKWNIELLRKDPDIIQTNDLSSLNELLHK
jgi:hypothetical protein